MRRVPGAGLLMLVLILAPVAASAWWLTRPAPEPPPPGPPLDELDVVCTGRVDAEGLVVSLDVGQPGRVDEVYVKEGGTVSAGQPILKVEDAAFAAAVLEAKAAQRTAGVDVDAAKFRAAQQPTNVLLQEKKVAASAAQVTAAEARLKQLKEQAGATSQVTKADVEVFEAQLTALRQAAEADRIQLGQLKAFDPQLEVRAAEARQATAAAAVSRAETALDACVLKAPEAGTVLRLSAAKGATLAPGGLLPAVVFAPAGRLVVRAELEQGNLGRVKAGMPAAVTDDTRPDGPKWTGTVARVAGWVAQRRSVVLEPGEMNDIRTAEMVVEIDPAGGPLWIGQRVQVRVAVTPGK